MAEFPAGPDGLSRRHYEAIAGVLREMDTGPSAQAIAAEAFADMLESGNPRFDRARFLAACGVES